VKVLDAGLRAVAAGLAVLAAACACAMVVLVVLSVAMRHLANAPFRFTEELVGLLLCATLFLALPQVTLAGSHVRVDLLQRYLGRRGRTVLGVLAAAVMVANAPSGRMVVMVGAARCRSRSRLLIEVPVRSLNVKSIASA